MASSTYQLACFFLISCVFISTCEKLPENIKRCEINQPDLNECLKESINDAINKMEDGAPNLGVPPLDPLHVQMISIGNVAGAVNLVTNFSDLVITGIKDTVVKSVEAHLNENKLYFEADIPVCTMIGKYASKGQILILPVAGSGICNMTFVGLKLKNEITLQPFDSMTGVKYAHITEYRVTLKSRQTFLKFDDMARGRKHMFSKIINNFLNENWALIFEELKPSIEEAYGLVLKNIANRIFSSVPYSEIFLSK